ncbi:MAG: phosphoadenylyl-sulfate reductase [Legionellales bacterium]|nr:phosphoadenylyl-sulfate reductase [Legionellales bacterium]|tara:strand:- start:37358 stop:38095 length:738 start_codon:yes stop_codon:yes gene_type:complete
MSNSQDCGIERGQLPAISLDLEASQPQDILGWATGQFGADLIMATSYGLEGMVIIHMLHELKANLTIINLDTGYQFPETLRMQEAIKDTYGFDITLVKASTTTEEYEAKYGGKVYEMDPNQCCFDRKVRPLQNALAGKPAWISSIRREQTPQRAAAGIVEWDDKFNLIKINPLANWTLEQVNSFINDNKIPTHPLYQRGFKSIGCWPCTRAVEADEAERAGRWSGFEKLECGLHTRATEKSDEHV